MVMNILLARTHACNMCFICGVNLVRFRNICFLLHMSMSNIIEKGFTCAIQLPRIHGNSDSSDESGYKTANSDSSPSGSRATFRQRRKRQRSGAKSDTSAAESNLEDMIRKLEKHKIENLKKNKGNMIERRHHRKKHTWVSDLIELDEKVLCCVSIGLD